MAKKTETAEVVVEIKPIEVGFINVTIEGISPLILHKWSEKAKKQILDAQQQKIKGKKEAKDPEADCVDTLYWLSNEPKEKTVENMIRCAQNGARFGFPAVAVKKAAMSAAYRRGWVKNQMALRGAFFIHSDKDGLVEIKYDEPPEMREDMVKINMGSTADIRYRAQFPKWHMNLTIEYDKTSPFTLSHIISFLNAGGFGVGIGEWRPERDGMYGRFVVKQGAN